jgi:hypothetical protein
VATSIPEWYFESVALWHKNRQNGWGSPNGQSTRTALRLVGVLRPAPVQRPRPCFEKEAGAVTAGHRLADSAPHPDNVDSKEETPWQKRGRVVCLLRTD